MSDKLGTFKADEFKVMKPKQQVTTPPPPPKDGGEEPPDDNDIEEIPEKSREEIRDALKKAGIGEEVNDEDEGTDEGSEEKPKDDGTDEGGEEKPKDEGTNEGGEEKQKEDGTDEGGKEKPKKKGKVDKGTLEDIEGEKRREKIKSKNVITQKINDYNTVLEKDSLGVFKLPNKVKNTLEKAVKDLEQLKNEIS